MKYSEFLELVKVELIKDQQSDPIHAFTCCTMTTSDIGKKYPSYVTRAKHEIYALIGDGYSTYRHHTRKILGNTKDDFENGESE